MLILWVRLDYTCTPRGGTSSLRMTDFNNSTEVAPIGPLTPSHKRKNLLSFHSGRRNILLSQTFLSLFHDNQSEQTCWHWQLQQWRWLHFFFYSARHKKQAETGPIFHVFHIQHHLTVQMYCSLLIKTSTHTATGDGFAGSPLRSNKYLFVNSKIAT